MALAAGAALAACGDAQTGGATDLPPDFATGGDVGEPDIRVDGPALDAPGPDAEVPCEASCEGRQCGPDGCGGSCGGCTDLCTGGPDDGLCAEGQCVQSCGRLSVSLTYEGKVGVNKFTAYLLDDMECEAVLEAGPGAASHASEPTSSLADSLVIEAIPGKTIRSVLVVAEVTSGLGPVVEGCTRDVAIEPGDNSVTVALVDGPVFVDGTYLIDSQMALTDPMPPTVGGIVELMAEMSDDDDLYNEDPSNGQYGKDPAAFFLDLVFRQFCCWEAQGPGATWDSCRDQEEQHPFGDLSAIYIHDFTTWEGAQPIQAGLCGALGKSVTPGLQALLTDLLESNLPGIATLLANIPADLDNAFRHMRLKSELTLANGTTSSVAFTHRLVSVKVDLHDMEGVLHEQDIDLAAAGLTKLVQTGKATPDDLVLNIGPHPFELETGKLMVHIWSTGLLPLLGWESTEAMLASFIDCAALALEAEDFVPDLGLLDAEDYEGFCQDGLEEAAKALEDLLADFAASDTTLIFEGSCQAGELNEKGGATKLVQGTWQGSWAEGDETGPFPGAFSGTLLTE